MATIRSSNFQKESDNIFSLSSIILLTKFLRISGFFAGRQTPEKFVLMLPADAKQEKLQTKALQAFQFCFEVGKRCAEFCLAVFSVLIGHRISAESGFLGTAFDFRGERYTES